MEGGDPELPGGKEPACPECWPTGEQTRKLPPFQGSRVDGRDGGDTEQTDRLQNSAGAAQVPGDKEGQGQRDARISRLRGSLASSRHAQSQRSSCKDTAVPPPISPLSGAEGHGLPQ